MHAAYCTPCKLFRTYRTAGLQDCPVICCLSRLISSTDEISYKTCSFHIKHGQIFYDCWTAPPQQYNTSRYGELISYAHLHYVDVGRAMLIC
eukprot:564808-Pleurochrysis_carterae.AAC.1